MLMMTENYWANTVYGAPPLESLERCDASAIFDWLSLQFPTIGTKIDWPRVSGRHAHWRIDDEIRLAAMAAKEVCLRTLPDSVVEHVGDGLSPYGVRFTNAICSSVVAELLEIPEHHFFLAVDRSWIVVVSTEGDLDIVDQLRFENDQPRDPGDQSGGV
ncbi:hypothetical protein QMK19_41200 [Streptomyces sp. H10-C2]|uniref:hypothetical protein n=1 Tax=unclassified Streptomyces TaxID=2593676 RepID=UPI0024BB8FAD|nr:MULTISPECIES: hypothetical protein [unclassified Streptomyces]MDJ0347643.1 hypothetical protein [Streptomyces sp. PH10-H1]MDJ0375813.1 hypothetical protein [Streptomyces sp. H10-C2]